MGDRSSSVSADIVAAVQRGDRDARRAFVDELAPRVARALWRGGVDRSQLPSETAAVFEAALSTLSSLPALGAADVESYLDKLATRRAGSEARAGEPPEIHIPAVHRELDARAAPTAPARSSGRLRLFAIVAIAGAVAITIAGIRAARRAPPAEARTVWLGQVGVATHVGPPLAVAATADAVSVEQRGGRAVYRIGDAALHVRAAATTTTARSACFSVEMRPAGGVDVVVWRGVVNVDGAALEGAQAVRIGVDGKIGELSAPTPPAPTECTVSL